MFCAQQVFVQGHYDQNKYGLVSVVTNVQSMLMLSPSVAITSPLVSTLSPPLHSGEEQKMLIIE